MWVALFQLWVSRQASAYLLLRTNHPELGGLQQQIIIISQDSVGLLDSPGRFLPEVSCVVTV